MFENLISLAPAGGGLPRALRGFAFCEGYR